MATTQTKHKRRIYYVNPRLQGRIISRLAAYWCVYHVMLWHAMFLYRYLQHRDAVLGGAREIPVADLYFGFALQNTTLIVCASLAFPLFLWDVFMLSHRIAGPLVRFQKTLRNMSEGGQVSHIELRKGDLLFDLRDSFNDYLDSLEGAAGTQTTANSSQPAEGQTKPAPTGVKSSGSGESSEFSTIIHDLRDIGTMVRNVKTDDDLVGQCLESYAKEAGQN